jgi:hypothetical protein
VHWLRRARAQGKRIDLPPFPEHEEVIGQATNGKM